MIEATTEAENVRDLNVQVAKALGARAEYHDGSALEILGVPNRHRHGWAIYLKNERMTYPRVTEQESWSVIREHVHYTTDPARILEVQAAMHERFGGFVSTEEAPGAFVCWPNRRHQYKGFGETAAEAIARAFVAACSAAPEGGEGGR